MGLASRVSTVSITYESAVRTQARKRRQADIRQVVANARKIPTMTRLAMEGGLFEAGPLTASTPSVRLDNRISATI